jgi:hypothetical protein
MSALQLNLILLFRSIPNDDIKLRELLDKIRPHRAIHTLCGRRRPRAAPGRRRLERRRNEAIAELTLAVAAIAMVAAIVAAVRS